MNIFSRKKSVSEGVKKRRVTLWIIFYVIVYVIIVVKFLTWKNLDNNLLFGIYSIAVSFYVLSRFALGYLYNPTPPVFDASYEPTVSFSVPAKNEEENIRETIVRLAASDYPKNKFNIIAVNDGSTDGTLSEMRAAQKEVLEMGVHMEVVDWKVNRGKRAGMAEGVLRSRNEIVVFIDSDSFIEPNTLRELIKYFADKKVAAVAGHGFVANPDTNTLTKMQAVRYYVAFKAYKAAESLFGTVTCCSGCCSAYRREYVLTVIHSWMNQEFLGVTCTYGDDRSLTNFLLEKGYMTLYAPTARAYTVVPDTFKKFMRQQLRWKKSWTKESIKASSFIWRRNPLMSISFYVGIILPLVSPIVAIRAFIWYPYATGKIPWFYLIGLVLMALCYGFYYYIYTQDRRWAYGVFFVVIYTLMLIWQLPWAFLSLRDTRWGTR